MTREPCEGCDSMVKIAGGIANLWTFRGEETGGMTLVFDADDTEHFLCFDCIDDLPDDPTAGDVAALRERE